MIYLSRCTWIAALLLFSSFVASAQGPTPELWYYHHSYISSSQAVQSSEALIDTAVAAGYTGVAFADSSFNLMSNSFWPPQNFGYLQQVLNYAAGKGLKIIVMGAPFGHSSDVLMANPNWAEAQRVVGAQFKVDPTGTVLQFLNSFPGLANGGFESGKVNWFDLNDVGVGVDSTVSHSGGYSGVITNAPANARFRQLVPLKPWRQYHIQLFYKTQNFSGAPAVYLFDAADFSQTRLNASFNASGNTDWTELDYTFNSQSSTQGYLYLGEWGGNSGKIWFDDIFIEETDLVYVARRPGTPVQVYDPNNPAHVYQEGVDYNYITDARMTSTDAPFYDQYHLPTPVTLPSGTQLSPGQVVAIDSYSVFPIPGGEVQVGMCLTEPAILNWVTHNAQVTASVVPPGTGIFMEYDEMRQMNSCATCKAKNMSAAQLLDFSVAQSIQAFQAAMPGAPMYVWSDMFDIYHNAVNHYYNVEGDLTGSWTGLPGNVTLMNWNLGNLKNSLTWFSGTNAAQPTAHQQIIAGYYDSGNGAVSAQTEVSQAAGIPGVRGLMYTTWSDDYSQLQNFANAARASWPSYLASVPGSTFSPAPLPQPPGPSAPSGQTVSLVAKNSGKCLDVTGSSLIPGTLVIQWTCWGGANQHWKLNPLSDGSYEITSANSGMALDVSGGPAAVSDGVPVLQWPYWGGTNEKWKLQSTSDGYYELIVESSGKCLDVTGGPGATADGIQVEQWTCWGGDNQKWQTIPAN